MTTEQREESSNGEQFLERVAEPSPNDILCGKDKNCVHAPGSIRFRKIIESYRARYAGCLTKFDKMLITKEIYETLTQTSRFLKFNPKKKMWEEISPMAARDKCGHALRFANRTKSKSSKKKTCDAQEYAAPAAVSASSSTASAAGSASTMVIPNAAVAPGAVPLAAAVPPTLASATASVTTAPAVGAPAPISPAAAFNSVAQQVLQNAAATATTAPTSVHSQQLWGELAKRYNSMWNATQIPALAQAGGLRAAPTAANIAAPAPVLGGTSSAAITALAAAAAVRSNPSLLASLTAATAPSAATTAPSLAASAATAAAAAANAMRSQALLNAVAAAASSAASTAPAATATAPHPRRRPTLDDLCSILNTEQLYAKNAAAATAPAGK